MSEGDFLWRHLRELPAFRALLRAVEARFYQDLLPLQEPVLDLGCGDGHFASVTFPRRLDAVLPSVRPDSASTMALANLNKDFLRPIPGCSIYKLLQRSASHVFRRLHATGCENRRSNVD